jgi:integrase/recombinase XerD
VSNTSLEEENTFMPGDLVVAHKSEELVRLNPQSIMPAAIRRAGAKAEEKFAEFFGASIRNVNTRMAYQRAVKTFFTWIEGHRLGLLQIRPLHVAAYIEQLGQEKSIPTVKQNLAAIRELFDYLIVGQVVEMNPAAAVKGPSYSAKKGKTPVLDSAEARQLLESIDTTSVVGLRDRAVIGLMVYTFARVGAMVGMNVEDYFPQGKRWWARLHEKGSKLHDVPCHHKLEEYLDAYVEKAKLWEQKKSPLFRTSLGKTKKLTAHRMTRRDVYEMVRRRAKYAGIETAIGCHTFRATGITNYLTNGGTLEKAQQLANHESARTTKLYDRRDDKLSLDEVERITI